MKLFITGDLHFDKSKFSYLKQAQNEYDILCLTGDLLDLKGDDFDTQTQWIADYLRDFTKPVLVCSGNHDIDEDCEFKWLDNISNNIIVDNQIKVFGGFTFGIIPYVGANLFDFSDCDILLHHVPPKYSKTAIEKGGKDWGDDFLYEAL